MALTKNQKTKLKVTIAFLTIVAIIFFVGSKKTIAAIAVDGSPVNLEFTTGQPTDISYTPGASANFMIVGISITNDGDANGVTPTVSTVTFNGDSLTQKCFIDANDDANAYIYYMTNPDITTGVVDVTLSPTAAEGGVIGVMTFSGVDTSTPLGDCAYADVDEPTPMEAVVTSATGELVFDIVSGEDTGFTANASQSVKWDLGSTVTGAASTKAGAASVTMEWTLAAANHQVQAAVAIKPATGSGPLTIKGSSLQIKGSGLQIRGGTPL